MGLLGGAASSAGRRAVQARCSTRVAGMDRRLSLSSLFSSATGMRQGVHSSIGARRARADGAGGIRHSIAAAAVVCDGHCSDRYRLWGRSMSTEMDHAPVPYLPKQKGGRAWMNKSRSNLKDFLSKLNEVDKKDHPAKVDNLWSLACLHPSERYMVVEKSAGKGEQERHQRLVHMVQEEIKNIKNMVLNNPQGFGANSYARVLYSFARLDEPIPSSIVEAADDVLVNSTANLQFQVLATLLQENTEKFTLQDATVENIGRMFDAHIAAKKLDNMHDGEHVAMAFMGLAKAGLTPSKEVTEALYAIIVADLLPDPLVTHVIRVLAKLSKANADGGGMRIKVPKRVIDCLGERLLRPRGRQPGALFFSISLQSLADMGLRPRGAAVTRLEKHMARWFNMVSGRDMKDKGKEEPMLSLQPAVSERGLVSLVPSLHSFRHNLKDIGAIRAMTSAALHCSDHCKVGGSATRMVCESICLLCEKSRPKPIDAYTMSQLQVLLEAKHYQVKTDYLVRTLWSMHRLGNSTSPALGGILEERFLSDARRGLHSKPISTSCGFALMCHAQGFTPSSQVLGLMEQEFISNPSSFLNFALSNMLWGFNVAYKKHRAKNHGADSSIERSLPSYQPSTTMLETAESTVLSREAGRVANSTFRPFQLIALFNSLALMGHVCSPELCEMVESTVKTVPLTGNDLIPPSHKRGRKTTSERALNAHNLCEYLSACAAQRHNLPIDFEEIDNGDNNQLGYSLDTIRRVERRLGDTELRELGPQNVANATVSLSHLCRSLGTLPNEELVVKLEHHFWLGLNSLKPRAILKVLQARALAVRGGLIPLERKTLVAADSVLVRSFQTDTPGEWKQVPRLVDLLHTFATLHTPPSPELSQFIFDRLISRYCSEKPDINTLTTLLYALRKFRPGMTIPKPLVDQVQVHFESSIGAMSLPQISRAAGGLAVLGAQVGDATLSRMKEALFKNVHSDEVQLDDHEIFRFCHALAVLGGESEPAMNEALYHAEHAVVTRALASLALDMETGLYPLFFERHLWTCVHLGIEPSIEFLNLLDRELSRRPAEFAENGIAGVFLSMSRLGHSPPVEVLEALLSEVEPHLGRMGPKSLALMAIAFGSWEAAPCSDKWWLKYSEALGPRIKEIYAYQLSQVLRTMRFAGVKPTVRFKHYVEKYLGTLLHADSAKTDTGSLLRAIEGVASWCPEGESPAFQALVTGTDRLLQTALDDPVDGQAYRISRILAGWRVSLSSGSREKLLQSLNDQRLSDTEARDITSLLPSLITPEN